MRALTLAVFLVSGCATAPSGDIEGARTSWQGATYDEVVSRWGIPTNHTTLSDGRQVYSWYAETVTPRGRVFPSIGIFGGSGGIGIGTGIGVDPGGGELVRCNRTLFFKGARVAEQIWEGDPGYCSNFRR